MRSQRLVLGLAVAAPLLAACGSSGSKPIASSPPTRIYRLALSGAGERPPGAPHGTGTAIIAWHGQSKVCFRFAHLRGFANATLAHIHAGARARSGSVVVALSTGPRLHHRGCVSVSPAVTRAIWSRPEGYYVNVHSQKYPAGAVRAQL